MSHDQSCFDAEAERKAMSKSVREQVEEWAAQPREWWPQLEDAHEAAFDLMTEHRDLFAAAEENAAEVARLRGVLEHVRDRIDPFAGKTQSDFDNLRQIQLGVAAALQGGEG